MNREDLAIYEDARHWANLAMWSVRLQIERLSKGGFEISEFVMQPIADFHFLLISLNRLRESALLVSQVSDLSSEISEFDRDLPWLKRLRNVLEHITEYRTGDGRDKTVSKASLQVFLSDSNHIEWLGERVEYAKCKLACSMLFKSIQSKLQKGQSGGT
jgi:hypothetical protein